VSALAIACTSAYGLYTPQPCGRDVHVQCAVYDPNEVYEIATIEGMGTLILLEPGETILDKGAGMGDGGAWTMAVNKSGIFIKPKEVKPDTNFMVVTNFRHYTFSLVTAKNKQATTWVLSFDYPDTRALAVAEQQKKDDADHAAIEAVTQNSKSPSVRRNTNFMMRGSTDLSPTSMWDDGEFTHFQYATTRLLPAGIYTVTPDGQEAVTNFHMEGNTLVVHETAKLFRLRTGDAVLEIRNDGYTPDREYNAMGSTVPGVVRVVKDK